MRTSSPATGDYRLSASATNANNSFVTGSSGAPMLSLRPFVRGLAADDLRRNPCCLENGGQASCLRAGVGVAGDVQDQERAECPCLRATCVTAEKSRCFVGSLPNFWR